MEEKDVTKISTADIVKQMSDLDQQIDFLILKYEYLRLEMLRRFPQIKEREEFQQKSKTLK